MNFKMTYHVTAIRNGSVYGTRMGEGRELYLGTTQEVQANAGDEVELEYGPYGENESLATKAARARGEYLAKDEQ